MNSETQLKLNLKHSSKKKLQRVAWFLLQENAALKAKVAEYEELLKDDENGVD